jgi:hypothetical protein
MRSIQWNFFAVDNARVTYTKGLNSQKINMRGMGCALYIRCALSIHHKECRKSLGCVLYIGARYLPENTVYMYAQRNGTPKSDSTLVTHKIHV